MPAQLQIVVDGRWQSLESMPGDISMSTVYPGGSDELSWTPGVVTSAHRFRGGELVAAYIGGYCVWAGSLVEPDPSQPQLTAQGAWREGDWYMALDGSGNASQSPDGAIDQAIARGLDWTRPASIRLSAIAIDVSSGPVRLSNLLDTYVTANNLRWGVNNNREVIAFGDLTVPAYQTLPQAGGNGYALDNYVTQLFGRYINLSSVASTTSSTGDESHGHREDITDLTPRGQISAATAQGILANLVGEGLAVPQWTEPLQFTFGEILTMGGVPAPLETVPAGRVLRVHGGFELAQRLNGSMYLDMLMGQTQLAGGVLTVQPLQVAARNLTDVLALAMAGK